MLYFWIVHLKKTSQEFESLNLGSYLFFYEFYKFSDLFKSLNRFLKKNEARAGSKLARPHSDGPAQIQRGVHGSSVQAHQQEGPGG
jgi:hypothetical protein